MHRLFTLLRLTFVDRHTIHVLGDVIPVGPERGSGAPVKSELEEEKKIKGMKGPRGGTDWSREGERIGVTQEVAKNKAKLAEERLSTLEADQKDRRETYLQAEHTRSDAARVVKALSERQVDSEDSSEQDQLWHDAYHILYQNRRIASHAWSDWSQNQQDLKSTRSEVYAWKKVSTTKPNLEPAADPRKTVITWEKPTLEDRTESLYMDRLYQTTRANTNKTFGFSSDDPGLSVMQVSATLTYAQASHYIRSYFETPNPFGVLTGNLKNKKILVTGSLHMIFFLRPTHCGIFTWI